MKIALAFHMHNHVRMSRAKQGCEMKLNLFQSFLRVRKAFNHFCSCGRYESVYPSFSLSSRRTLRQW